MDISRLVCLFFLMWRLGSVLYFIWRSRVIEHLFHSINNLTINADKVFCHLSTDEFSALIWRRNFQISVVPASTWFCLSTINVCWSRDYFWLVDADQCKQRHNLNSMRRVRIRVDLRIQSRFTMSTSYAPPQVLGYRYICQRSHESLYSCGREVPLNGFFPETRRRSFLVGVRAPSELLALPFPFIDGL